MLRIVVVIVGFAIVGLTLVHLRSEQVRCAARTLSLENKWVQLRRETWSVQSAIARLRAPDSIHERSLLFQTDLYVPGSSTDLKRTERLAGSP